MTVLTTAELKKLQQKKYRQQSGCFLAEGEHLVLELEKAAQMNSALRESQLYVTEKYQHWPCSLPRHVISEKLMQQLSDTQSPQGVLASVSMDAVLNTPRETVAGERAVYLYQIQDPGNLGTILRTLAWFGGFRCLLSPGSVDLFNGKVVRASMGAIFHVPVETEISVEEIAGRYADIACLDMSGESLKSAAFHHARCLVFGNEARGVPTDLTQRPEATVFSIPGSGQIDSLNLASTVSMSIYELCR